MQPVIDPMGRPAAGGVDAVGSEINILLGHKFGEFESAVQKYVDIGLDDGKVGFGRAAVFRPHLIEPDQAVGRGVRTVEHGDPLGRDQGSAIREFTRLAGGKIGEVKTR